MNDRPFPVAPTPRMIAQERRSAPPGVITLLIVTSLVVGWFVGAADRFLEPTKAVTTDAAPAPVTQPPHATGAAGDAGNDPAPLTATAVPPTPTPLATTNPTLNDCPNHPQEGALCRMPVLTPAATVIPDCPVDPGRWCFNPVIGTTSRQETR